MSNIGERLKGFFSQCRRVFQVTKKPSRQEYKSVVKITGLGILIIGVIGFIITIIVQLLL